jgi:arsenite methyltransferase
MPSCFAILALVLAAAVSTASAQQPAPPRPTEPEEYAKYLERDQRAGRLRVEQVVATLKLQPGQKVADLGSGSGLFTRPIAKAVGPRGMVYAIDVEEGLLRVVDRTAKEQGLTNVKTIKAAEKDPGVPEPVDLIFVCDTLHHLPKPQAEYLEGLRKHLKPGGRIALIDFKQNWPSGHESLQFTTAEVDAWMTSAGFTRAESHDFIPDNFFFIYR